jgi:uncharacterized protein
MVAETIAVAVKPRSTRAGVVVGEDGEVVVRVHAAAVEGQANKECIEALAAAVGVPKSAVRIVRGAKSRSKVVVVEGMSAAQVRERLGRRQAEGDTPAEGALGRGKGKGER